MECYSVSRLNMPLRQAAWKNIGPGNLVARHYYSGNRGDEVVDPNSLNWIDLIFPCNVLAGGQLKIYLTSKGFAFSLVI